MKIVLIIIALTLMSGWTLWPWPSVEKIQARIEAGEKVSKRQRWKLEKHITKQKKKLDSSYTCTGDDTRSVFCLHET